MTAPPRPRSAKKNGLNHGFLVMLLDGPYDGQDIRATSNEMEQGVIVRSKNKYVSVAVTNARGLASTLPLFRWLEEAKIVVLPFLTASYVL
jgi:hypothetical protein